MVWGQAGAQVQAPGTVLVGGNGSDRGDVAGGGHLSGAGRGAGGTRHGVVSRVTGVLESGRALCMETPAVGCDRTVEAAGLLATLLIDQQEKADARHKQHTNQPSPPWCCHFVAVIIVVTAACRGDGFVTDPDAIRNMRLDDPRPFFKELLTKTYRKRTVLSPHFYGMTVTNNTYTGHQLWEKFTQSWGKLQVRLGSRVCSGSLEVDTPLGSLSNPNTSLLLSPPGFLALQLAAMKSFNTLQRSCLPYHHPYTTPHNYTYMHAVDWLLSRGRLPALSCHHRGGGKFPAQPHGRAAAAGHGSIRTRRSTNGPAAICTLARQWVVLVRCGCVS